jgi:hypothetical protein
MAAVLGLRNGLAQGSVVWALALLISVVLSSLGVAGALSNMPNLAAMASRGVGMTGADAQRLVSSAAAGSWWFVIGAVIAWVAAAGGGMLGAAAHTDDIVQR